LATREPHALPEIAAAAAADEEQPCFRAAHERFQYAPRPVPS
jgi:hypothetical protein